MPPPVSAGTVRHFCENEWALHLDDVMMRRSSWHRYLPDAAAAAARAAHWMAALCGWSDRRRQAEMERYNAYAG